MKKGIEKTKHAFMIKSLSKTGIKGTYFNIIKNIYEMLTTNIYPTG